MKLSNYKASLTGTSGDSFALIVVRLVTMVLSLLMTRVLSEHFSLQEYGTYSQVMLLTSTISGITMLGMMDGVNFFFCKETDPQKRNAYISTIFFLQYVAGSITAIVVWVFSKQILNYFGNEALRKLLVYTMVLPILQNTISLLQIMFIAIGRARLIAVRNIIVSILKLISIVVACYVFDNIKTLLQCQVLLEFAQIAYFGISLWKRNCRINIFKADKAIIPQILRYCVPMAMFTMLKSLNRDSDKFIISYFTNTETLAVYSNASKILPFDVIMTSFCTVLLPYITRFMAQRNYDTARSLYKLFLELSYMATSILAFGAICVAPELMRFLYTEKYVGYSYGVNVFIIYILVDVFSVMNITMVLSAAGKTKKIMLTSLCTFIANIVMNVVLFLSFHETGPALATLLVTVLQGILLLSQAAKEMGTRAARLIDWKQFFKFYAQIALVCIGAIFVRALLSKYDVNYFFILILTYSFFCCTLILLNRRRFLHLLEHINHYKMKPTDAMTQ